MDGDGPGFQEGDYLRALLLPSSADPMGILLDHFLTTEDYVTTMELLRLLLHSLSDLGGPERYTNPVCRYHDRETKTKKDKLAAKCSRDIYI
jgi:hypothetical protein